MCDDVIVAPANGALNCTSTNTFNSSVLYSLNSTCVYTCDADLGLDNVAYRETRCIDDGTIDFVAVWTHLIPPKCIGECFCSLKVSVLTAVLT